MRHSFEELSAQRVLALGNHDAVKYFLLCDDLGIGEHSIEDWELYENGRDLRGIASLNSLSNLRVSGESTYWSHITHVALFRFPSGHVSDAELKHRLRDIRAAGYDVPPYSILSRDDKWNLLEDIRKSVAAVAREHCPRAFAEVTAANHIAREEAQYAR